RAVELVRDSFPQPGDALGEFVLLSELGRGTTSRVFLARQPSLGDRPVVLKLTRQASAEPRSMARLLHTHVVPLLFALDVPDWHAARAGPPPPGGAPLWGGAAPQAPDPPPPPQRRGRDHRPGRPPGGPADNAAFVAVPVARAAVAQLLRLGSVLADR